MQETKKLIGFICPLSGEDTATRKRSDDIMEHIIIPAAKELGYEVQRADEMTGSNIIEDIFQMLKSAAVVIADLTEMNPNVFYELGVRDATKGNCINIICDNGIDRIPFDISHYRAYHYKMNSDYGEVSRFQKFIKKRIKNIEEKPGGPCMPLSESEVADTFNVTLVTDFFKGAKNHYCLAKDLFYKPCKSIFLMQRSSSLVLNAELGWEEEIEFINNIKAAMRGCEYFYHIITLEGIEAHFRRKNSVFPQFKDFANNLVNIQGKVAIDNGDNEKTFYVKKLQKDEKDSLFKLDRQARVLVTEDYYGRVKAVIVQNLGDNQNWFVMEGPKAKEYLDICRAFYSQCECVEWDEIVNLYKRYEKITSVSIT